MPTMPDDNINARFQGFDAANLKGMSTKEILEKLIANLYGLSIDTIKQPIMQKFIGIVVKISQMINLLSEIEGPDKKTAAIELIKKELESSPKPADQKNLVYLTEVMQPIIEKITNWETKGSDFLQKLLEILASLETAAKSNIDQTKLKETIEKVNLKPLNFEEKQIKSLLKLIGSEIDAATRIAMTLVSQEINLKIGKEIKPHA